MDVAHPDAGAWEAAPARVAAAVAAAGLVLACLAAAVGRWAAAA